jgi:hypothetical protein
MAERSPEVVMQPKGGFFNNHLCIESKIEA